MFSESKQMIKLYLLATVLFLIFGCEACPGPLIDCTKKMVNLSQWKEELNEEAETVQC